MISRKVIGNMISGNAVAMECKEYPYSRLVDGMRECRDDGVTREYRNAGVMQWSSDVIAQGREYAEGWRVTTAGGCSGRLGS